MISFAVDFDAFGEVAGTIEGMNDAFSGSTYLDAIANAAHDRASLEFDLTAAASAEAGYLSHVYEYNVEGITRGVPRINDATSPAARLWVHNLAGSGGMYDANFTFRDAVQPNPRPSTAGTGVSTNYIKKISRRKYVFRNKASIMETGQEVVIHPKRGSLLFVPFYGEPGPRGTGYMMWNADRLGPIVTQPGRTTSGTFTSFWQGWWKTAGTQIINDYIAESANTDVVTSLDAAKARASRLRPLPTSASGASMTKARSTARTTTTVRVQKNALARRGVKRR